MCYHVVNPVRTVLSHGHPQKKGVGPGNCLNKIKHVKDVCCVNRFCPKCAQCPQCCRRTECRGQTSKVLAYLARDGCESSGGLCSTGWLHSPLQTKTCLTRVPLVQNGYANPTKNMYLKEALVGLMHKLVVERVVVKSSLAFYNCLFLVPKPNRKWRPILDLSWLNLFLSTGTKWKPRRRFGCP